MYYGHGLKICMWFGYNPWIIFCHFFHNLNLVIFSGILVDVLPDDLWVSQPWELIRRQEEEGWIMGTLCAQLLLQFNTDTFETLQTL